jgi:hypothetical protein
MVLCVQSTLIHVWVVYCNCKRQDYHPGPLGEPPHLASHFDALRVQPLIHLASITTPPILLAIMSTKEDDVQNALKRFEQKEFRSIRQTALATTQARLTLGHRRAGRLPRSKITVRNARLIKQQREILFRYIRDLQL